MSGKKTIGGVKTIDMWWWWETIKMWWGRESNGNVVVVIYSFTIQEDVLKKVESGVDVWSMWGRCKVDMWSMYLWMKKYIE